MFLSALAMILFGVALCLITVRVSLGLLGLRAVDALVWLGLAEVPAPPAPRRRRLAA